MNSIYFKVLCPVLPDAIIIFSKEVNGKTQISRVTIDFGGHIDSQVVDSNRLVTSHGKTDIHDYIKEAFDDEANNRPDGGIYYWNEKKAQMAEIVLGTPQPSTSISAFNPRITGANSVVKSKFDDPKQTKQFNKWFGKSVVTEDGKPGGEPIIVYHNTDQDITVFKPDYVLDICN